MFDVPDLLPCPALTLYHQLPDDDVDNGDDVGDADDASSSPPSLKPATGGYMFPSAI